MNPVNGAVGLLWTGNWHVCQSSVETVLRGGALGPLSDSVDNALLSDQSVISRRPKKIRPSSTLDDHHHDDDAEYGFSPSDLDLCLMVSRNSNSNSNSSSKMVENRRAATPSEESDTTTLASSSADSSLGEGSNTRSNLLRLFM